MGVGSGLYMYLRNAISSSDELLFQYLAKRCGEERLRNEIFVLDRTKNLNQSIKTALNIESFCRLQTTTRVYCVQNGRVVYVTYRVSSVRQRTGGSVRWWK